MTAAVMLPGETVPAHTTRHSETGFTLLEMMVAMVVLAMIVTTAFGALRLGERSWEAGLAHATETETLRTVAGLLQRQFNQILPIAWTGDRKNIAFSGARDQLRFIAPAPHHHGATGLFEFTLVLEPHEHDARLVLYYQLHDPDRNGLRPLDSDRQQVVLVEELESATFAYYGSPVAADPPEWHSQWSKDAEAFPQLVRARFSTGEGQRQWPELLLALHAKPAQ